MDHTRAPAEDMQVSLQVPVGACLEIDLNTGGPMAVTADDVVARDGEHDAEYLGSVQVAGGPDATWPGEDALFEEHLPACIDHFDDQVGRELRRRGRPGRVRAVPQRAWVERR